MLPIHSFGQTDIGLRRSNNEDAFLCQPELAFWAVADGMGGAASGEVAGGIFADAALEIFSEAAKSEARENHLLVQETFRLANERILTWARNKPEYNGMGCTAELLTFSDQNYVIGHVGDSRTYLSRQGQLKLLTRDHSLVQDQVDQGLITLEEARKHPLRNVILRAVGVEETLALDIIRGESFPGDFFLLCSDGLTNAIDDRSIQEAISLPLSLTQKVERLIQLAKLAGGDDNITVILCEVFQGILESDLRK
jgi:PPM family protein phosphatase